MKRSRNILMLGVGVAATMLAACGGSQKGPSQSVAEPATKEPGDIQIQAVYDADDVAIRFTWKSHEKTFPATFANVGQVYPGQFHDLLKHNGTAFAQVAVEDERLNEDRVSFMIEDPARPVAGFAAAGCYVACHTNPDGSLMASHKAAAGEFLDHWHWRGMRSGPMGYAEDAYVDGAARQRDALGTPGSRWVRAGGDRLREDQGALTATGHATAEGMPRFVFNKGKNLGGFILPTYFLSDESGAVITNEYVDVPKVKDVTRNRTLLIAYQDKAFDAVDKINALDLGYLVYVAKGTVAHLPAHLRDTAGAPFAAWTAFWATETGIAATPADAAAVAAAEARLAEVNAEWEVSGRKAMITRSIGFIYPSDQHDIATTRSFDAARGIWTVTMYRKLNTTNLNDTSLGALATGQVYNMGFAVHDVGDAHESHHISLPTTFGNAASTADIKAQLVADVKAADWNSTAGYLTRVFQPGTKSGTYLKDALKHPGAGSVGTTNCRNCHTIAQMPAFVAR